jgi:hypothetical protein
MKKIILIAIVYCIYSNVNAQGYELNIDKDYLVDAKGLLNISMTGVARLQKVHYSLDDVQIVETSIAKLGVNPYKTSKFLVTIDKKKIATPSEFELNYLNKRLTFHQIGQEFYVTQAEKNNKVWTVALCKIEKSSLRIDQSSATTIFEGSKKDNRSPAWSGTSPNNSKYSCILQGENSNFEVKMFNGNFLETWSHSFNLENIEPSAFVFVKDAIITDNGHAILHIQVLGQREFLVIVNSEGVQYQDEITVNNKEIYDIKIKLLNSGTVGLVGTYGLVIDEASSDGLLNEGMISLLYDLSENKIVYKKVNKFSLDFLREIYPDNEHNAANDRISFDISDVHQTSDGNIYVIGQRVTSTNAKYFFHEIVVISMDSEGDLGWGKSFEFDRNDKFPATSFGSETMFSFMSKDDNLSIVYNRHRTYNSNSSFILDIMPSGEHRINQISSNESFVQSSFIWQSQDEVVFLLENYSNESTKYRVARIEIIK